MRSLVGIIMGWLGDYMAYRELDACCWHSLNCIKIRVVVVLMDNGTRRRVTE